MLAYSKTAQDCTIRAYMLLYKYIIMQKKMVEKMTTDAQKKATAKYLAGKKTFTIRVDPEEAEQIQKAAEKQGKSVNAYILDAVQAWMEQEQPND